MAGGIVNILLKSISRGSGWQEHVVTNTFYNHPYGNTLREIVRRLKAEKEAAIE